MSIDDVIKSNLFRKDVYDLIPEGSERILDFGCNRGELLLRLQRDKNCKGIYGVELRDSCQETINKYLDKAWNVNLEDEGTCLGEDYKGFFNYIVLHDVIEHLYDPWYTLAKLKHYLAEDGKIILVTPNFQFWGLWRSAIRGNFSYGSGGGLLNEEHIRWFSAKTLTETLVLSGYRVVKQMLYFPNGTDLSLIDKSKPIHEFSIPPKEIKLDNEITRMQINFEEDIRKDYEFLLANKLLMVAQKSDFESPMMRVSFTSLNKLRDNYAKWQATV